MPYRVSRWFVLALVPLSLLCVGWSPCARAEDAPPEDRGATLRRARVAESAERDLPKAIALYRSVFMSGGDDDLARDAGLSLADLLEARGDRAGALDVAKVLTARFASRLDDTGRRRVHETMARCLPAGSHAKSPLGDVYVLPAPGTSSNPAPSPLETKVLALLSRLDGGTADTWGPVEADVLASLLPVVRDALPLLEQVLYDARPERARFAARAIGETAGADALPILLRAIERGDGFTRAAATVGLRAIEPSDTTSPSVVAAVEPLLVDPRLTDRRSGLRDAVAAHQDVAACLARAARGGSDAPFWVQQAERRDGETTARWLLGVAGAASGNREELDRVVARLGADGAVSVAARVAIHEYLSARPLDDHDANQLLRNVDRLVSDDARAARAAIDRTWAWALHGENASDNAVAWIVGRDSWPAPAPWTDPATAETLARRLEAVLGRASADSTSRLLHSLTRPGIPALPGVWEGLRRHLAHPERTAQERRVAIASLHRADRTALPDADVGRWLDTFATFDAETLRYAFDYPWVSRDLVRSGDRRALDLLRQAEAVRPFQRQQVADFRGYRGPGIAAYVLERLPAIGGAQPGLTAWAAGEDGFWKAYFDALAGWSPEQRQRAAIDAVGGSIALPAEFAGRAFADLELAVSRQAPPPAFVVAAAAANEPGEFLRILRTALVAPGDDATALRQALAVGLADTLRPPHDVAFVLEVARGTTFREHGAAFLATRSPAGRMVRALLDETGAAEADLVAIASDPEATGWDEALAALVRRDATASLARVFEAIGRAPALPSPSRRSRLVEVAAGGRYREALPWLRRVALETGDVDAVGSLERTTAHVRRLAAIARGPTSDDPAALASAVLGEASPALQKAALFALVATEGERAAPALLELARRAKDEGVRAAALETLETLGRRRAQRGEPPAARAGDPEAPPSGPDEPTDEGK